MTPKCLLMTVLALVMVATTFAQSAPSVANRYVRTQDVVYGRKHGVALTLDVFQPTGPANGFGVIALVSGGWRSSHDNISPGTYVPYLERGYTVFAVVHGSQPKFTLSEIVPDVHRAVRFIRFHAGRWSINPDRLGVTGSSAGGHLSLTLATQGGLGLPEAKDPVDRVSSAVQAVACFYPPTDFLNYGAPGKRAVAEAELKAYQPAFGPESATPEGRERLGELYSPARYITATLPPVFLVHGDADKLVPLQQSEWFRQRAQEMGVGERVKLVVKAGGAHGWPDTQVERRAMALWFDEHLREVPTDSRH